MRYCKKFRVLGMLQQRAGLFLHSALLVWMSIATVHAEGISVNKAEMR